MYKLVRLPAHPEQTDSQSFPGKLNITKGQRWRRHVCAVIKCQDHCDVRGGQDEMTLAKQEGHCPWPLLMCPFLQKCRTRTLFTQRLVARWLCESGGQTCLRKKLLSESPSLKSLGKPASDGFIISYVGRLLLGQDTALHRPALGSTVKEDSCYLPELIQVCAIGLFQKRPHLFLKSVQSQQFFEGCSEVP